ncbi:hypothetical protein ESZ91_05355 [Candidatus Borkfalkia ceftriaxoniphila]|uniref:Uncharacterized protein n=1 Tax=Candidatus Borkfalkia ceftriaxoniphila TaxID=2508949 RepID=A0A4Q2KCU1_9FIRM|nr:hypothetical protein [Candidatus Borkfalkia ceftriaxoniphila]RXZ61817.1 hypothetical protein ESZ91_05355 [Candidatus Borkfalkia ceftriaxoniphila]
MKKPIQWIAAALICAIVACSVGCDPKDKPTERVEDTRNLSAFEYTEANLTATDALGRTAPAGDISNGNDVGVFYHTWHGVHETPGKVLDITKIMAENPDYLGSDYLYENADKFHYWGEPLYGYYCSADPWVITRHVELMMAMGIDFLVYDYTNATAYNKEADAIFEVLQNFRDQGFNVPKVTFYTNTRSADVVCGLYRRYYEKGLYKDLWYAPDGKPLIIGVSEDGLISAQNRELYAMLKEDFFDFRESQWPDGKTTIENLETGFPWMSWQYPQKNFNGMMSVSLAQHPDAKMSNGPLTNNGRGFDYKKMRNYTSNSDKGTNYQGQWETVFENNADSSKKYVDQVLVTGFNEWMAIKLNDGNDSYFVDTFSEEYSRDIEMMKGGYGDNFVVQTLINTRKYKYSDAKHYKYDLKTMPLDDFSAEAWKDVKSEYKDPVGDALARDYRDAFSTTTYVDNSNRNDISSVRIAHDTANLYVRVETAEAVTAYNGTDKNWMNLLIQTENGGENSFAGFQYIVNRSPDGSGKTSVEKSRGGFSWESAGSAQYAVSGNVVLYSIPLASLGLTAQNCYIRIKACDNVTKPDDIMDYYVSGDSAPIGRFAYSYGY